MTQNGVSLLKLQGEKDHPLLQIFLRFLSLATFSNLNPGFPLATMDRREEDWEAQSMHYVKEKW